MSSDEDFRVYAITDALRRVAPDEVHLADSISFAARLEDVSPASPGFDDAVRAALRAHRGPSPAEAAAEQAAAADRERAAQEAEAKARRARGQWTEQDLAGASPDEQVTAYERGQLAAIGMPPIRRPERRELPRPVLASRQQAARWRSMPPWAARRAIADWRRQLRSAGGDAA